MIGKEEGVEVSFRGSGEKVRSGRGSERGNKEGVERAERLCNIVEIISV